MSAWLPTAQHIILLHEKITARTGGASGIRDMGLIESALARASAAFGGVEAYSTVLDKAAATGCGLTQNHGFVDGNKRVGIAAMLLILRRNDVKLCYTQEELIALGLGTAQEMNVAQVIHWLEAHLAR